MQQFVFIVFITLLILSIYVCFIKRNKFYSGGGDSNDKVFYHGSDRIIDELTPRPSGVIDNEKAVFATSSYIDAVIFSALWTDYNFSFGSHNGKKYLIEQYPGAFEKLNTISYIHHLPATTFHHDSRCGLSNEYISFKSVTPTKVDKVSVKECVEKSNVELIKYDNFVKLMRTSPKQTLINKTNFKKIKAIYIPIDSKWGRPSITNKTKIIHFDRMSKKEINKQLSMMPPKSVILMGDIYAHPYYLYDFGDLPLFAFEPSDIQHFRSTKTTKEEYLKYIESRKSFMGEIKNIQFLTTN